MSAPDFESKAREISERLDYYAQCNNDYSKNDFLIAQSLQEAYEQGDVNGDRRYRKEHEALIIKYAALFERNERLVKAAREAKELIDHAIELGHLGDGSTREWANEAFSALVIALAAFEKEGK